MSEAETIARALGGSRSGNGWVARCCCHDDHQPSLSLRDGRDGKLLVFCHAGCDSLDILKELRERGLVDSAEQDFGGRARPQPAPKRAEPPRENVNTVRARIIWDATVPIAGTKAETYLRWRGITIELPPCLRFGPACWHSPSTQRLEAMVAAIHGPDGTMGAITRTYLARQGPIKANVSPVKMALGHCRGGAIRLAEPAPLMTVCEGIETGLAIMQATGLPCWATGGTRFLEALVLPALPLGERVIIGADGDEPGEAAAQAAAKRWTAEGRRVRIARPPRGYDFADVVAGKVAGAIGAAPDGR